MDNLVKNIGKDAKIAQRKVAQFSTNEKNECLLEIAQGLLKEKELIFKENKKDVDLAKKNNLDEALIDRLVINEKRLKSMSNGLKKMASLEDPCGEIIEGFKTNSELSVSKVRVPIGVIGMIYESRPNVTIDAFGLAFKSGNAIILRGGSEAIHSNRVLMKVIQKYGKNKNMPKGICQLIKDTDRKYVDDLIKLDEYIDVIIPRGGEGLKKYISENSTVPMIITGSGLCHIFVDKNYDKDKAIDIIENAKVQRPGVCNAIETLLVHEDMKEILIKDLVEHLKSKNVEIVGCKETKKYAGDIKLATKKDFNTEYLKLKLSIKVVKNVDEAIEHINKYSTNHSESILTNDYKASEEFLNRVDASTVYVNSSTRFTDGAQFGLGGEIGISTQKLHARGPMGLKALTTFKYKVRGNGQIRK
ncbi:MAG: glutamate-5-semialdehyde dehydrogenase [Bacillota bacterium]